MQRLNPSETLGAPASAGQSSGKQAGKPAGKAAGKPANSGRSGNPAKRNGAEAHGRSGPATAGDWISGARLRTLPLAIAPVALGTGAAIVASDPGVFHPVRALLALIVALCLQIGVNYANDYSDGIRGTDAYRVGPARLTGGGAARPRSVLTVALAFFGLAAFAGLVLVILSGQWWLLLVGAAAIVAAWFYTGGKRPYGYFGLGELFVFVFFGLVATAGTTFVQVGTVNLESWLGGVAIGLIACAVLMVNNLRDIVPDKASGKRTLAVLIGNLPGRIVFCVLLLVPFLIAAFFALFYPLAWFVLFVLLLALPACLITVTAKTAAELILALKLTSFSALLYGLLLGAAFAF
ncbi:1,4-dihydroxy-2-naphthoate polyprenyltransferase [Cryobacterium sp. MDB1-18-2]|uniref:1,4-dihydroxy-2-naphthoate polyprenyltransferase n=1 Tax=unclassified Cryobacterium TaxID=2649013 RepID=UPI001069D128|nr:MULTISPECIES: 1,4-dihydroxy-2-naphthoate polyprenyltransferase [unclassified Cryobacterium]TFC31937.1 1,4-dihydroxy-2-naphthoate polyprenyltransferase [Cryobacterium sp. MDB1-18-2]TFC37727.1 1,4-dihydroxy-2-naphthoate polyprenyltransferase [Cryobacterium sp. MDB1-18-1]